MKYFVFILILTFLCVYLANSESLVDLTCPNWAIDKNTPTGLFPSSNRTERFPTNYTCSFNFTIPDGWVVKFSTLTTAMQGYGDALVIIDSVSTINIIDVGQNTFFSPANHSQLSITTTTNSSFFWFSWQYIDVSKLPRAQIPIGSPLNLNLTSSNYYTFTSTTGPVAFHVNNLDRNSDLSLIHIYVYDGANSSAPFIGTLLDFTQNEKTSSGNSLTLINFYGTNSKSFGIANDFSTIAHLGFYKFYIMSIKEPLYGHWDAQNSISAATFYSIDSKEVYLTDMRVDESWRDGVNTVDIAPLSPSNSRSPLLSYSVKDDFSLLIPQQMFGNLFTITYMKCVINPVFEAGPFSNFSSGYIGRKGFIYSPNQWDSSISPSYSENFTSSDILTYSFDLSSVKIGKSGDKIRIEFGSPNLKPVAVEFTQSATNTGVKAANATYMSTTFTATSPESSFVMSYAIESPVPIIISTTQQTPASTSISSDLFEVSTIIIFTIFKLFH